MGFSKCISSQRRNWIIWQKRPGTSFINFAKVSSEMQIMRLGRGNFSTAASEPRQGERGGGGESAKVKKLSRLFYCSLPHQMDAERIFFYPRMQKYAGPINQKPCLIWHLFVRSPTLSLSTSLSLFLTLSDCPSLSLYLFGWAYKYIHLHTHSKGSDCIVQKFVACLSYVLPLLCDKFRLSSSLGCATELIIKIWRAYWKILRELNSNKDEVWNLKEVK